MHVFDLNKEQQWDMKKHVEKVLAELEPLPAALAPLGCGRRSLAHGGPRPGADDPRRRRGA